MRAVVVVLVAACGRVGFAPLAGTGDASSDGTVTDGTTDATPAAPHLVAHTMKNGHQADLTTAPIDTTGASVIVVAECTYQTGTPVTPIDSMGNTWLPSVPFGANMNPATINLFFAFGPMTSASHTFKDPGNDYVSIGVLAFAGRTISGDTTTGNTSANPFGPGVIKPASAGAIVASFACSGDSVATSIAIDGGFTRVDFLLNGTMSAPEDMGSAYLVAVDTAPLAPHWTFPGDTKVTGMITMFP